MTEYEGGPQDPFAEDEYVSAAFDLVRVFTRDMTPEQRQALGARLAGLLNWSVPGEADPPGPDFKPDTDG